MGYNRVKEANSRGGPPPHHNDLFHKLREVRIAKGLTQNQLANKIGIHSHEMHRYEWREHLPNADTFIAWLEALDFKIVSPDLQIQNLKESS
jgi:DNA-binding XRE family transcriptional regulator